MTDSTDTPVRRESIIVEPSASCFIKADVPASSIMVPSGSAASPSTWPVIIKLETYIPEGEGAGGDYHRQARGHWILDNPISSSFTYAMVGLTRPLSLTTFGRYQPQCLAMRTSRRPE